MKDDNNFINLIKMVFYLGMMGAGIYLFLNA